MQRLGPYRIGEVLGEGGMGVVYRAVHERLRRPVALKVLRSVIASPGEIERFDREIRIACGLSHPNLVKVFDGGQVDSTLYLAMELIEGPTLAARIGAGPRTLSEALHWMADIARGTAYIHEQGTLHRDLKPQNILCDPQGHARIADFGLARNLGMSALTQTGHVVGTPRYLAPELFGLEHPTPATDLWSIGCIYYELLTGMPILQDRPLQEWIFTLMNRSHEIQDPAVRVPGLPPEVSSLAMDLLTPLPERRGTTAGLLGRIEALCEAASASPSAFVLPAAGESGTQRPTSTTVAPDQPAEGMARISSIWSVSGPAPVLPASSPGDSPIEGPAMESPAVQVRAVQAPAVQAPAVQARVMQAPARRVPAMQAPAMQAPAMQAPAMQAPAIPAAAMQPVAAQVRTARARTNPASSRSGPALAVAALSILLVLGLIGARDQRGKAVPAPALSPQASSPALVSPVFGEWRKFASYTAVLEAGGVRARRAAEDLNARSTVRLGLNPAPWLGWFRLGRWLADPGRPPDPPRMSYAHDGTVDVVEFQQVMHYLRGLKTDRGPALVASVIATVLERPEDPRFWLMLGRVLEREGARMESRVAYRHGLAGIKPAQMENIATPCWEAFAAALLATEPDDWPTWLDWPSTTAPEGALTGFPYVTFTNWAEPGLDLALLKAFEKRPALAAWAFIEEASLLERHKELVAARETARRGLARFPRSQRLMELVRRL